MHEFEFLQQLASEVAPRLLGCVLERQLDNEIVRVKIVETEAYDQTDEASHSYHGETARTRIMFGEAAHLYVYFTYGMHYCCNIVVGPVGYGAAVLIRAVEPLEGETILQQHRPNHSGVQLTNGPAKLCQALAIDSALNGHDLTKAPLRLLVQPPVPDRIIQTERVGIRHSKEMPWRFYIYGNPFVSKL